MYFNGFTLLLMFVSAIGGLIMGIKIEEAHQERLQSQYDADRQLLGRTIEEQMRRDGWSV